MKNVVVKIVVQKISSLYAIVKLTQELKYKVVAKQGNYAVDASSVMGLCCLDLMSPFSIKIRSEDVELFEEFIDPKSLNAPFVNEGSV